MTENPVLRRIANSERVIQYFGYWPGFHDAEIKKVTFEANPGYYPTVTFLIAAFETTRDTEARGSYRQMKHCEIELRFTDVKEIDFDGFGHQNVILEMEFAEQDADLTCTINGSVGVDAFIVARAAEVIGLTITQSSIAPA
ncbi:hypothetical protein CDA63_05715 [Hymenobacter amundsenii]|uniref:Uncharacterized protein n=1 Tax=Hymenobacter amundsenii TaxID=2006685 RepID=A0A246FMK7_9BACT|nr:Imm50 family immunity protein [Hymenobacter amundsenii]OWP63963.1 hypothetical protein CDA63_05715 [Hymenobacter amundsenii]